MSLKTVSGILAAAVADAGTVAINYPTGFTRGDFVPGVDHRLVMGQVELKSPSKITISFGATAATVTNKTGATWPANTAFVLQLELPGNVMSGQQLSTTGKLMLRTQPWALRYLDLGSPVATAAANLRAAAAIGAIGAVALLITALDVPRNIIFTSTIDATNCTFTITSKDIYGNVISENVVGANGGVAAGKKAHFSNIAISASAVPTSGNISIGVGNVLGLPCYLPNAVHILKELQDGASAVAGTTVAGDQTWPTATTGDVRGTYVPNAAPDGMKAYGLIVALADPDYLGSDNFTG